MAEPREADEPEALCPADVVQRFDHLRARPCAARRLSEGSPELRGMYFHVGEEQACVLDEPGNGNGGGAPAFTPVHPGAAVA
ncbi:hypothetical protein [Streptomyces sp. KL2]|uniref:hypothetical protein n=1 Tax=Streptomyces sp. KL2 TaxID=3050126 RepID=UPI00397E26CB